MFMRTKLLRPAILWTMAIASQSILASTDSASSFESLAKQCAPNVDVGTLSAIVTHESRLNPYAIGLNSKTERLPRAPRNREEAVATAEWLLANGYSFDSGYGQVNSGNIEPLGLAVADLFDPCKNLQAAGRVLTDCYDRALKKFPAGQPALQAALSCYNTGNFEAGFANGYVALVAANATLPVPALEAIKPGPVAPIKLQAAPAQDGKPAKAVVAVEPDPRQDVGMTDVFGASARDAFTEAREAQDAPGEENPESQ